MPKHNFEFFSSDVKTRAPSITVDRQGRIKLSASFREMIKAKDVPVKMYVGYDKIHDRFALAPPDTELDKAGKRPYTFDKNRGYANAKALLEYFRIPYKDKARRYIYVDRHNGAYVFAHEDEGRAVAN